MKIATIVGARPQFIKAASVSRVIENRIGISEVLIHTGQHFDANMSDVFFDELDIRKPDYNLGIGGGTHGQNTGRMFESIEQVLLGEKPDWVLVYGDTDSTLAGALAAVKLHIPVAHVEAGLRSFNRRMPEEINRVLTDHASSLLFAPTQTAVKNLEVEGIKSDKVRCVGDVMYDVTLFYKQRARKPVHVGLEESESFVICTIHRAENTNDVTRLKAIVTLLNRLAEDSIVVLPLHPRTKNIINQIDEVVLSENVRVIEPVSYLEMTWLLSKCGLVMTDSGGVQKEAFFHQKPCVTLRDETEWVELVEAGYNRLVIPHEEDGLIAINEMRKISIGNKDNLYGNGEAAVQVIDQIGSNE